MKLWKEEEVEVEEEEEEEAHIIEWSRLIQSLGTASEKSGIMADESWI